MAHFDGCYIKIHFETQEFLVAPFCKFVLKVTHRKQELSYLPVDKVEQASFSR